MLVEIEGMEDYVQAALEVHEQDVDPVELLTCYPIIGAVLMRVSGRCTSTAGDRR
jgi:hypothetical protein